MTLRRCVPVLLVLTLACGGSPQPPAPTLPSGLDNPALGVGWSAVPTGWEVLENSLRVIRLGRDGGEVELVLGEVEPAGVNLLAGVERRQRDIEARGGTFAGSRELITPWGPAFTARGRWSGEGGEREELSVIALHPAGWPQALLATYRYPLEEGATTRRSGQLLELLGEVQPHLGGGEESP